jgi:gliding motility-associated-like protein
LKFFATILFLLTFLLPCEIFSQGNTEIQDVVNKYTKVVSIVNTSTITVSSAADFKAGDTVMIIQMKGIEYSSVSPNIILNARSAGKYEFIIIQNVTSNTITFLSQLKNVYDAVESVQLVKVPSYENALVKNKLTCAPWDGEKGGVLAIMISGTLTMNAEIDVSEKGFRGATPITYATGKCFASSSITYPLYKILNPSPDSSSGYKGEGVITNKYIYRYGIGHAGSGGGAGAGLYSGGGGGSCYGSGGNGGKESCATLYDSNWGGLGGTISPQFFGNESGNRRIYIGGGGGSGIQKPTTTGTPGGNGGGIAIILAQKLTTNNFSIKANGGDASQATSQEASSGGGGGGGTLLLVIDSLKNNLIVSSKGGNGGDNSNCYGQGGGGGGGFVWFAGKQLNFYSLVLSGGIAGRGPCDVSSTPGQSGDSLNRLLLPLTGFLNNTIKGESDVCYSTSHTIKGSRPQGGNGIYTYLWKYRNYGSSTWITAPGRHDTIDYTTPLLTDSTEFQRTVTSDGMTDISKEFLVKVFPQITNNVIAPDTTICFGSPSVEIRGSVAGGGTGNIHYLWSQKTTDGTWETAPGENTGLKYAVVSDETRLYRRTATSDFCSTHDIVTVEVLPVISNNLVSPQQTICYNSKPLPFAGETPQGGDLTYKYNWQKSNDSINWTDASINSKNFSNPPALTQTTFYRRIVMSGLRDCCLDTSKKIKVRVVPLITNNSISAAQTICEDSRPALFNGSNPGGGDITGYRYQWESSSNKSSWDSLTYSPDLKNYQASEQTSTRYFRRIVLSGLNDCCKDTSNSFKVTVQPKISANLIKGDTTICKDAIPQLLKGNTSFTGGDGTSYTPLWEQRPVNDNWSEASGEKGKLSYQPSVLTDTIYYKRVITSGTCTSYSNIVAINVLSPIKGNVIAGNASVCEGFPSGPLNSEDITGGEPGNYKIVWEKSKNQNNWDTIYAETNPTLLPGVLPNDLYFRRKISSGAYSCCTSTSNILKVTIDKKPEIPFAGTDREIFYQDTAFLNAQPVKIGSGTWTTSSEAEIYTPEKPDSKVINIKFGQHTFYWTVTNGVCPSVVDSVTIILNDLQRYTGFSPNGDNVNDYFEIDGLENAGQKDLTIINRWGIEVFHSSNYDNKWDGRSKNGDPLPEDTYYYVFKVNDIYNPGKQRIYKGYVVIKR